VSNVGNKVGRFRVGVLVSLVGALIVTGGLRTGPAQAVYLPTVGPNLAREQTFSILREQVAKWRYRSTGWVDCSRGKINRTTWACRITIINGRRCTRGRARVYSEWNYYEEQIYYQTRLTLAPSYPCRGVGY
jgi:hypothetical protein